MSEGKNIVVASLYGVFTQKPRVQMTCQEADFTSQMSPAEARDVALNLLECSAAAEFDAVIVGWLADMGMDQMQQARALTDLRERLRAVQQDGYLPR